MTEATTRPTMSPTTVAPRPPLPMLQLPSPIDWMLGGDVWPVARLASLNSPLV